MKSMLTGSTIARAKSSTCTNVLYRFVGRKTGLLDSSSFNRLADVPKLWELIYKEESPEWKKWDAPYFEHKHVPYEEFVSKKENIVEQDNRWVIEVNGEVIGTVSYYWEHKPSNWLEMGIAIYNPKFWSSGYGTRALRLWIGSSRFYHLVRK